jgi:hypothetical protein
MKRKNTIAAVFLLAGSLVWAPTSLAADEAQSPDDGQKSSFWWSWWSWGEGLFGVNFGGVSYGDGPKKILGSDKLVHQLRTVSDVRSIELEGPIDIVVKQGQTEKITVHTDDNIAPLLQTRVDAGILHIGVQPGVSFRTKHPIGMTVELTQLTGLKVLGSGDVTCAQFDTELFEITVRGSGNVRFDALRASVLAVLIQGSGDVHLSGTVPKQGYVIEGSGDVDADELVGRELAVRVIGSGDAKVWATDTLAIEIGGSGDVSYRGQPAVSKSVHGSGSISHH